MKCPHCLISFHANWSNNGIGSDADADSWILHWYKCPSCAKWVFRASATKQGTEVANYVFRPLGAVRPVPPEVPPPFSTDFREAVAVLNISPKASAALSRRLLQHVLIDQGKAKRQNLVNQIEELLPNLPAHLQDLHAIRQIGNFAAHPSKDTNTGEIVEVEPGEAEWLLDILERLFDFYFVQPAIRRAQIIKLNEKLKAAGKPELPVPS